METLTALGTGLSDSNELFELAASDDDDATLESIELDANGFQESWKRWNSAACSRTRPTR